MSNEDSTIVKILTFKDETGIHNLDTQLDETATLLFERKEKYNTLEKIEAALQEDVDVIGLSILSGAHMSLAPRIMDLMDENDMADVPVFLGGIIPQDDVPSLKEMGITGVFGPGTSTETIIASIRESVVGKPTD